MGGYIMTMKIAIVSDSSISFSKEEIEKYELYVLPNIIIHGEKSYEDQLTITNKDVNELLSQKELLTSSQPSLGKMVETFEEIKEKEYDHIIILTVSKYVSGVYNAFKQAIEMAKLENYSLIDTLSAAGPAQQAVRAIRKMNAKGDRLDKIINYLHYLFVNQVTYIVPNSLDYIVKSGRVSKTKARIASLFRIRTALYLKKNGTAIEELGIARTDTRIYDRIIENFKENKVTPEYYDLYLSENMAADQVETFKEYLFEKIGVFHYHHIHLPAVLSTHTGPQTLGVQWCPKIPD